MENGKICLSEDEIMEKKHYVLQYKKYPHGGGWVTFDRKYDTYEEAEAARQKTLTPSSYRVAESYTVVRYKAVKK